MTGWPEELPRADMTELASSNDMPIKILVLAFPMEPSGDVAPLRSWVCYASRIWK